MKAPLFLLLVMFASMSIAAPLESVFTYQGELTEGGNAANGQYDFEFSLFDASAQGNQIGVTFTVDKQLVANGVFSVLLDFGTAPFDGQQLWLEIAVRSGNGDFTTLQPRQQLSATPYALHAEMVAANAIAGPEIANNSIAAADIAGNAVGASELANNAVDTAALQDQSVTSAKLAPDSVSSEHVAPESLTFRDLGPNSVGTSEIRTSQVQRRVSERCPEGTALTAINEDGSVECQLVPTRQVAIFDENARDPSIAIRSNNLPVIAYVEPSSDMLMLVDCLDPACLSSTIRPLTSVNNLASSASRPLDLALRADDRAIISYHYFDFGDSELRIYDCNNAFCSSGSSRTLDTGNVGDSNQIALRADGTAVISYHDNDADALKFYQCDDINCASGDSSTLDNSGNVGSSSDIALSLNNTPVIAYRDNTNSDLKIYVCDDPDCNNGASRTLAFGGGNPSLLIGADGRPLITHRSSTELHIYDCDNASCLSGIDRTVDTELFPSNGDIQARVDAPPLLAYSGANTRELRLHSCNNARCSNGQRLQLAPNELIGGISNYQGATVAVRADGKPVLAYSFSKLRVHSCGNNQCL